MFSNRNFFTHCLLSLTRSCLLASTAAGMLGACSLNPVTKRADGAVSSSAESVSAIPVQTVSPMLSSSAMREAATRTAASPPLVANNLATDAALKALSYADRVRSLSTAELVQEISRLGEASTPVEQLQLALTLSQLRQTPELIRAQDLLTRLLANASPEAQTLHPLARLLAARYGEQRRLEDQLDKQAQQTRDVQRRLDQTNERLEALKAIERSLTSRSAPSASPSSPSASSSTVPTNRARSATP